MTSIDLNINRRKVEVCGEALSTEVRQEPVNGVVRALLFHHLVDRQVIDTPRLGYDTPSG